MAVVVSFIVAVPVLMNGHARQTTDKMEGAEIWDQDKRALLKNTPRQDLQNFFQGVSYASMVVVGVGKDGGGHHASVSKLFYVMR